MIPLLSPKAFADFTAEEFHLYIKSLHIEPAKREPPADVSVRLNDRGTPVITVRRDPKWLSPAEVAALAREVGWTLQALWLLILKRKIEIRIERPASVKTKQQARNPSAAAPTPKPRSRAKKSALQIGDEGKAHSD